MKLKQNFRICPVWGYTALEEPPYNEYEEPAHEICRCCGFEFGFDDGSEGYTFLAYLKNG